MKKYNEGDLLGKYVENVAFFMTYGAPVAIEEYHANSIFQNDEDEKYIRKIENEQLNQDILKTLTKVSDSVTIEKTTLTLSRFGVCNLRIFCNSKEVIDPDTFSFDSQYADIYNKIDNFLKSKKMIQDDKNINTFVDSIDPSNKYLYHQHIVDKAIGNDDVKWSIYKYKNDEISNKSLDIDSLLLERHILYYVFSKYYVELFDNTEKNTLSNIRLLLNTNRKLLARHELLLQELDTEHFEKFNEYLKTHHIDNTAKIYDRLENNIEHLSEQLEDERRHKEAKIMESIFFVLAVIGLISIITGILALLPGTSQVCDTNSTSSQLLTTAYTYSVGEVGKFTLITAVVAAIIASTVAIVYLGISIRKKLTGKN